MIIDTLLQSVYAMMDSVTDSECFMNAFKVFLETYRSSRALSFDQFSTMLSGQQESALPVPTVRSNSPVSTVTSIDGNISNVVISEAGIIGNAVTVMSDTSVDIDRPRSSISPLDYTERGRKYGENQAKRKFRVSMYNIIMHTISHHTFHT